MLITLFEQSKGRNPCCLYQFTLLCTFYLTLLPYHQTARNLQDTNSVEKKGIKPYVRSPPNGGMRYRPDFFRAGRKPFQITT